MDRTASTLGRRAALALGAAALARPALAQLAVARTLRFVPHANLGNFDPVWTPQLVTRVHGFLVCDTLYGRDAAFRVQPQMAEGYTFEQGGGVCTVTLCEGLHLHDGERFCRAPAPRA